MRWSRQPVLPPAPRARRPPRPPALAAVVVLCALAWPACGSDRTGGPRGRPDQVVGAAPDATLAAGTARVAAVTRGAALEATLDLRTGLGTAELRGSGGPGPVDYGRAARGEGPALPGPGPVELVGAGLQPGNPLVAVELLRGAVAVEPYGGSSVRGVSTIRYTLAVEPARVASLTALPGVASTAGGLGPAPVPVEVWIDASGRVRRIQLGSDLRLRTTTTDGAGLFPVVVLDFVDFGVVVP